MNKEVTRLSFIQQIHSHRASCLWLIADLIELTVLGEFNFDESVSGQFGRVKFVKWEKEKQMSIAD